MEYKFVNAEQLDADLASIANAIRTKTNSTKQLAFPLEMEQSILDISTGVELNFEVVGNPQPVNPKENTIWVNTSTAITDYVFEATQPTAATGRVWILTGASSQVMFNALKKNWLYVYPISVKQYVNGAWVDRTAKSYIGGKWVDWWTGELYKDGKLYNVLENGFEKIGTTVVEYKNGYFIYYDSGSGGCITSPKKLSTTGYKTIKITGGLTYQSGGITYFKAGLASSKNTTSFVSSVQFPNNSTTQTISINIPSDGGEYYLVLACGGSTSATNCVKITKIIME